MILEQATKWETIYYEKKVLTVVANNSTNINKTKESFNSDGQQFYQYLQNKRKF